jgi:general secretion pathway protein E/type IV pilus assembly protein PilB
MSLVQFLLDREIVDRKLCEIAQSRGGDADSYISDLLINSGELDEEELTKLKAEYFGCGYTTLKDFSAIPWIDYEILAETRAVPFSAFLATGVDMSSGLFSESSMQETSEMYPASLARTICIAVEDPTDFSVKDKVARYLATTDQARQLLPEYYVASKTAISQALHEITNIETNLIEKVITDAVTQMASDIHIIPAQETFQIMLRIDGLLIHYETLHIDEFQKFTISLKVLAKLNISETRRPQSGHFQKDHIDFRISTHPTIYGENIVIRVLSKNKNLISIDKIGFAADQIEYLKAITAYSCGMIIFCGPTGSGKTTSIYALLEIMDKKTRNIMTLEDPVEYKIAGVRQTEIVPKIIDFADGVRSILRQDPDVILSGEIRDEETAKMAIRAAMTGHLVLTTIHANDCFGVISRLREFDISNALIADNLVAIVSQRLVKRKTQSGRTIVAEILNISSKLRDLIYSGANMPKLREHATAHDGFKSMQEACQEKVDLGFICKTAAQSVLHL